jgi:hypothetical protein
MLDGPDSHEERFRLVLRDATEITKANGIRPYLGSL